MNTLLIRDSKIALWLLSNPVIDPPANAVDAIVVVSPIGKQLWPVVDGARK